MLIQAYYTAPNISLHTSKEVAKEFTHATIVAEHHHPPHFVDRMHPWTYGSGILYTVCHEVNRLGNAASSTAPLVITSAGEVLSAGLQTRLGTEIYDLRRTQRSEM